MSIHSHQFRPADDRWVTIYCRCGHRATVQLPDEPWQHRDKLLPRCVCCKCGRRDAEAVMVSRRPGQPSGFSPHAWGGVSLDGKGVKP